MEPDFSSASPRSHGIVSPLATPRGLGFGLVVVIAFAYYAAGAASGPYWLDSSELAAQAFELGVAHPPGHPLFGIVGKAAALLPVGPVAFRVALAAALCAALAAGLLFLITLELAARLEPGTPRETAPGPGELPRVAVAAACALLVALGYSFAFQAVRPEVYALEALCALAVLYATLRHDAGADPRWLYLAALVGALGLGNHHLLMSSVLVPAAAVAVARRWGERRGGWRVLGCTAGFAVLGLCVWLYLPLRAARAPEVNWGDARTPARFAWTVSARAFSGRSVTRARDPSYAGAPAGMLGLFGEQLGPLGACALLGIGLLARRRPGRRCAALVVGVVLTGAAATWLVGFDAHNPDIHGYLGVPLCVAAAAAGAALIWAVARAASFGRRAAALARTGAGLLLCLPALVAVSGFPEIDLRNARGCETVARAVLDAVPVRGTLLTSNFQTAFSLWYLRGVEGARPDIAYAHLGFLGFPGYIEALARRTPELALLPASGLRASSPAVLQALAAQGPLLLQYDLTTDHRALPLLAYDGLLARVFADPAAAAAARAPAATRQSAFHGALARRLAGDEREQQTASVLLFADYVEMLFHCAVGASQPAAAAYARASARSSRDPDLLAAAQRCGLRILSPSH